MPGLGVRPRRRRCQAAVETWNSPPGMPGSVTTTVTLSPAGNGSTSKMRVLGLAMSTTVAHAAPAGQMQNCANNC
jgi:hypothetical protein